MAGYTDCDFRRILVQYRAKVVWTEMVSAAALFYGNKKTLELLKFDPVPGVKAVVQLFGKDPKHFEFAIKFLADNNYNFDEININMGCPANKIVKNGEGVALMSKPELAREIIETCVRVSPVPVSVKMRLGFKSTGGLNPPAPPAVGFAKMCQEAGASRVIVHGRYGDQGYSGTADWPAIAEVVRAVQKIPVIANGDIKTRADAQRCLDVTGAAGVMVGRALLTLYRKYFSAKLQTLRGAKIQKDAGIVDPRVHSVCELFTDGGGTPAK